MKKRRMMKNMLAAWILLATVSSTLLGQSQYVENSTLPDDGYIPHREIPESILEKLKNTVSAHRLRLLDDTSIQKENPARNLLKPRAVGQPVRVRATTPTNTLMNADLTKPVFSDDDQFGFAAIADLKKSAVTEETLKKAILASGHIRAGAPLEKSVLVMSDGTRMEVDMPVGEDGALNLATQFEHDGQTYAMTNLRQRLVGFYAGTNITQIGVGGLTRFDNLVQVDGPTVTNIQQQGLGVCPNLLIANFPIVENIDINAFIYDGSLKYVNMPNLTRMGGVLFDGEVTPQGNHFMDCTSLEVVDFPNLVSIDGAQAFYECENLRSIFLPKLETVPFALLEQDYKVKKVDFSSATNLQNQSWGYDASIEDWVEIHPEEAKNYEFTFWFSPFNNSSVTSLSLPSMLNVDKNMFRMCQLTEIHLPSATNIADYAFYGSENLKKVYAPNLVSIGYQSMYNCHNLQEFDAKNLQKIGNEAFMYCRKLREARFPLANTIGERAFKQCNQLGYADLFSADSIGFETFFSCHALSRVNLDSVDHTKAQAGLPQNRNDGFAYCNSMEEIRLPNAKILGSITFSSCNHLKKVVAPSCEEVWRWCFHNCVNLEELFFCDGYGYGVTNIVKLVTGGGMPLDPFDGISHRVNVIVPDALYGEWRTNQQWTAQNVNIYSWSNYQPARMREFSPQVVDMGTTTNLVFSMKESRTFTVREDCSNPVFTIELNDVSKLPSGDTSSIDNIKVNKVSGETTVIVNRPGVTTLKAIRNGLGKSDFFLVSINGNNPLSINGPATVKFKYQTTGDTYAYISTMSGGQSGMASANLNVIPYVLITRDDITYETPNWSAQAKITFQDGTTKDYEFGGVVTKQNTKNAGLQKSTDGEWNEPGITRVSLGEAVTGLDNGAFYKCPTLNEILLPNTVSNIGTNVFSECTNLASITMPGNLTTIGGHAFDGCGKIEEIALPSGVNTIGVYAFNGCTQIKDIRIPDSVESIGESAFLGCTNVNSVIIFPNGGDSEQVKQKLISAGVTSTATWFTVAHRWSFNNGDYTDTVGGSENGSVWGGNRTTFANGQVNFSGGAWGWGSVDLGKNLTDGGDTTIEIWAKNNALSAAEIMFEYGAPNNYYVGYSQSKQCFAYYWSDENAQGNDIFIVKKGDLTSYSSKSDIMPAAVGTMYHFSFTFKADGNGGTVVNFARRNATTGEVEASGTHTVPDWTLSHLESQTPSFSLNISKEPQFKPKENAYNGQNSRYSDAKATYDEVRIWNGALSYEQLERNAKAGPNSFTPRN